MRYAKAAKVGLFYSFKMGLRPRLHRRAMLIRFSAHHDTAFTVFFIIRQHCHHDRVSHNLTALIALVATEHQFVLIKFRTADDTVIVIVHTAVHAVGIF